jgi:hypothetical protein
MFNDLVGKGTADTHAANGGIDRCTGAVER